MRPLVIAVLLLSCAGDETRRSSEPRVGESSAAQLAREPAPPARSAIASAEAAAPPAASPEAAAPPVEAIAPARPAAPAAESVPLPDPRAATREAAHDALAANCGECHEGHRSHAPKALAVFDLDLSDWPSRFNEHRFASALRRLQQKSQDASAAFIAFRDAEGTDPSTAR
jgi:hypothetical protein